MNLQRIPQRTEGLLSSDMEDGTVIVSPTDGRLNVVNEVGGFVWERIDGENTVAAIIELVTEHFSVEPEQATDDVLTFLDSLAERDLLNWKVEG